MQYMCQLTLTLTLILGRVKETVCAVHVSAKPNPKRKEGCA